MNAPWKLVGACGVALVFSVATLPAANDAASTTVPANPTFTKDVLPIFQKSCETCHRPGHMAPFSTQTYEDARPWARSIKQKVESRYMPPWHIDRTIGEYRSRPVAQRRADLDHLEMGGQRRPEGRHEGRAPRR